VIVHREDEGRPQPVFPDRARLTSGLTRQHDQISDNLCELVDDGRGASLSVDVHQADVVHQSPSRKDTHRGPPDHVMAGPAGGPAHSRRVRL
jgi:hypothetical protein